MEDNLEERIEEIIKKHGWKYIIKKEEDDKNLKKLAASFPNSQSFLIMYKILNLAMKKRNPILEEILTEIYTTFESVLHAIEKLEWEGLLYIRNYNPYEIFKVNKDKLVELDKYINNRKEFKKYIESKNIKKEILIFIMHNYFIVKSIYTYLLKKKDNTVYLKEIVDKIKKNSNLEDHYNFSNLHLYYLFNLFVNLKIVDKESEEPLYIEISKYGEEIYFELRKRIKNYIIHIDYIAFSILNAVKNNKGNFIPIYKRGWENNIEKIAEDTGFKRAKLSRHILRDLLDELAKFGIIGLYESDGKYKRVYYITRDDEVYKKAKECLKIYNNIKDSVGCLSKYIENYI